MKATIDPELCDGKFFCRPKRVCPTQAIKTDSNSARGLKIVDAKLCIGCGICIGFCDQKAIKMDEFFEKEKQEKK